jgi:homoserine kinase type II
VAVYTAVGEAALAAFLAEYEIGRPLRLEGIPQGVENTNYRLVTEAGTFILTLYERRVAPEDLPFFLDLMDHLAARGVPCPTPIHGRDGRALRTLAGRPATIVTFLRGRSVGRPQVAHCAALGGALARVHREAADFPGRRANALSLPGWRALLDACLTGADTVLPGLGVELAAELEGLEASWPAHLPSGVIHGDLFPDNVFFEGFEVTGIIDFYFACNDLVAYDLAVCLNAWCFEPDGQFNITKARRMLEGYTAVRPLSPAEIEALPLLCRGAALRFLLTRLFDWLNQVDGALVRPKDPLEYWRKLRFHRRVAGPAAYGLAA